MPTGTEVKRLRTSLGIGLRELSRQLGVTPSAVSQTERRPEVQWATFSRYVEAVQQLDKANVVRRPLLARTLIQAGLDILSEIHDTTASR